jgi:hypothetical protein
VRRFVLDREPEWRWWGEKPDEMIRPAASIVAVRPVDRFEEARPDTGVMIRVRCWCHNTNMGLPAAPVTELTRLSLDGNPVKAELVEIKTGKNVLSDCYYKYHLSPVPPGKHKAEAEVRAMRTGKTFRLGIEL